MNRMTFLQAIEVATQGHRVSRETWNGETEFIGMDEGHLRLHLGDGWHTWDISEGDIAGADWVVVSLGDEPLEVE